MAIIRSLRKSCWTLHVLYFKHQSSSAFQLCICAVCIVPVLFSEISFEGCLNYKYSFILFLIDLAIYSLDFYRSNFALYKMSRAMRKQMFCICENKDADQLRGNHEADQRLCFHYTDSSIPLLPKYEIQSL